jgi:Sulfotransferase domain
LPLKIIGAGSGRTGTTSLYMALGQLGFPGYHLFELVKKANRLHLDFWRKVASAPAGSQHDCETAFANDTAAVDNPACCVWQELLEANSDAKIVLSLHPRGPEAWYQSAIDTIYATETMWQFKMLKIASPWARKLGDLLTKLVRQRSHQGTMADRAKAIAYYRWHIESVKSAVPGDRLLIFSAGQVWEPLCGFLSVPVPASAYPEANDRAFFKKNLAGIALAAFGVLAVAVLVVGAALYGAARLVAS